MCRRWRGAMAVVAGGIAWSAIAHAQGQAVVLVGTWATSVNCGSTPEPVEVKVSQFENTLSAILVGGGSCWRPGHVAWSGDLGKASITSADLPVYLRVRTARGPAQVTIESANRMIVVRNQESWTYTRGAAGATAPAPAAGAGPAPARDKPPSPPAAPSPTAAAAPRAPPAAQDIDIEKCRKEVACLKQCHGMCFRALSEWHHTQCRSPQARACSQLSEKNTETSRQPGCNLDCRRKLLADYAAQCKGVRQQADIQCVRSLEAEERALLEQADAQIRADAADNARKMAQRTADARAAVAKRVADEIANAEIDPAIEVAKKHGVKAEFFGISLGIPVKELPSCTLTAPRDTSQDNRPSSLRTDTLPSHDTYVPPVSSGACPLKLDKPPRWIRGRATGIVSAGVLTSVAVATDAGDEVVKYLHATYGKHTRQSGRLLEWVLPGIHVAYTPPAVDTLQPIGADPARVECADYVGNDCTPGEAAQVEARTNALVGIVALALMFKQLEGYETPNLLVETETAYKGRRQQ